MTRLRLDDQTIANSKLSRYTSSTVSSTFLTISSLLHSTIDKIERELVESSLALKDKQRIVRYVEASIERLLACEVDLREKLVDMERSIALLHQTE